MELYGFSPEDIALRIAEACTKKGAACTDAAPPQLPGESDGG
jgi:hypothetical protein